MIKIILDNEQQKIERELRLNLRRHKQYEQPSNSEKIYLIVNDRHNEGFREEPYYIIAIDGKTKKIVVRRKEMENLGFEVEIQ